MKVLLDLLSVPV